MGMGTGVGKGEERGDQKDDRGPKSESGLRPGEGWTARNVEGCRMKRVLHVVLQLVQIVSFGSDVFDGQSNCSCFQLGLCCVGILQSSSGFGQQSMTFDTYVHALQGIYPAS